MNTSKSVPDRLIELSELYKERATWYGKDYKHLGESLVAMFPDGLKLSTAEEFNRFALFIHVHGKVMRYAQNMLRGGHADSLDDISVYAQLMRECDDVKA
jgi:hypothetical protein